MASQQDNYRNLSDAIFEAKRKLGIQQTTIHDKDLSTMAQRSLLRMNNLSSIVIKNETLDVVEGIAPLPSDCLKFISLRYCGQDGVAFGAYVSDFAYLSECSCGVDGINQSYGGIVMINDRNITFKDIVNAPSKIKIAYRGRTTDENGLILIKNHVVEAVTMFICWQFAEENSHLPTYGNKYQYYEQQWKALSGRVVSLDARESFNNNYASMVSLSHPRIISL
jgi:hypothetical protein